jgi:NTP pyrophosphatase (non-canonical NTP hydrolase)
MQDLIQLLRQFRDDRDWAQFHDSKNLALALSIEAAELNELFLWTADGELPPSKKQHLREELADVIAYALLLADKHQLNIDEIVREKVALNAAKYPVDKSKGNAAKYTDL